MGGITSIYNNNNVTGIGTGHRIFSSYAYEKSSSFVVDSLQVGQVSEVYKYTFKQDTNYTAKLPSGGYYIYTNSGSGYPTLATSTGIIITSSLSSTTKFASGGTTVNTYSAVGTSGGHLLAIRIS